MSRRRWVYTSGGNPLPSPVEVTDDWRDASRDVGHKSEAEVYGKLQAVDGTDLSTRKRHRDYMKREGLAMREDYKNTLTEARKSRDAFYAGDWDTKARREDVARAVYKHKKP